MTNKNQNLTQSELFLNIAKEFQMPFFALENLIRTAPHRYKHYTIPKKGNSKKLREIAHPAKELKIIQRWILKNYLHQYPIHESAHAYEKRLSIKTNAEKHSLNSFILKMDFSNFFQSIVPNDLLKIFNNKHTFDSNDNFILKQILFYKNNDSNSLILSVGAPSSPKISNIVMYEFDKLVSKVCQTYNVVYTRYADDLTFSTNKPNILKKIEEEVCKITDNLDYPRLLINESKTIHLSKKMKRRVTGLIISNDGNISLGRERKRLISAAVHNYSRGIIVDSKAINELKGWISFASHIEPDFTKKLSNKYKLKTKDIF